jgi:hypothetical protein
MPPLWAGPIPAGPFSRRCPGSRRGWERSANRVIEADLSIPLTRLRPEGGTRLHCLAVQRFAERAVTGCNRHAPDFLAGITGEAEAIDQLVALIEVRPANERWCGTLARRTRPIRQVAGGSRANPSSHVTISTSPTWRAAIALRCRARSVLAPEAALVHE